MNIQMRWITREKERVLQFRTCHIYPHWGDWQDVEDEEEKFCFDEE